MIKHYCDVCQRPLGVNNGIDERFVYKIKVKRRWWLWHESGWESIEICADCARSFYELWKKKKEG